MAAATPLRVHRWCASPREHTSAHLTHSPPRISSSPGPGTTLTCPFALLTVVALFLLPSLFMCSRFLDHIPHAIESVDVETGHGGRLAVLRANADIEVWNLKQNEMHCELRIAGAVDTCARRVVWGERSAQRPAGRLFSCGLHGLVTEWDLHRLSPRASWDSLGGAAWTLAHHAGKHLLAVGCEDGGCSIFDTSDESADEPTLVHRTPPQGGRLLCVSFSPQGSHLACSAADGSVRVWHVNSWQAHCRYVLESDGRRKPPLVWSVLLLSDLTCVSGDSTGHVNFYDGRHGTLVRRFASHSADVLALAASADESKVFASGVDQKVVCFCPQPAPPMSATDAKHAAALSEELAAGGEAVGGARSAAGLSAPSRRRETSLLPPPPRGWMLAFSRRPHTHDVRALCTYEPLHAHVGKRRGGGSGGGGGAGGGGGGEATVAAPAVSMLISGGIDTQICLLPLATFERAPPEKLLPFPQRGAVGVARQARLLLSHNSAEVHVWRVPPMAPLPSAGDLATVAAAPLVADANEDGAALPRKLLLLRPKLTQRNVSCAAISDAGRWLVICDSETRLYRLSLPAEDAPGADAAPAVKRVPLPASVQPAACCAFSADERLLLLGGLDGCVTMVMLEALPAAIRDDQDEEAASRAVLTLRGAPGGGGVGAHGGKLKAARGGGGRAGGGGDGGGGGEGERSAIVMICMSDDGQWIATADAAQQVHCHSVDGLCFSSALPPLASSPTALAFLPSSPILAVASASKLLTLYDVDRRALTPWSLAHGTPIAAVAEAAEVPHTIAVSAERPRAPVLVSQSWLCRVPTDGDAPSSLVAHADGSVESNGVGVGGKAGGGDKEPPEATPRGSKKKRKLAQAAAAIPDQVAATTPELVAAAARGAVADAGGGASSDSVVRSYGGILTFAFVGPAEALVVEQPWLRVMDHFPPALYRHRFGT